MTELERLAKRLEGVVNFNVFWGPKAHLLTPDERAAHLNKVMDAIDNGDFEEITELDGDLPTTAWDAPFEEPGR